MKGIIINYRMGRHTQNPHQMIIKVKDVNSKDDAKKLKGKTVVWETKTGKKMEGKVLAPHGNKGAVRAKFEKGLPGQSIGTEVKIL